jgi:hypothetical protein
MLLSIIYGNMHFRISLSKIFDKKDKRFIDLNEIEVSSGLSGLAKRIILKNFHKIGKHESLREALNIYVIRTMAFFGRHLVTSAVIRSKSGDFFFEYFRIVCLT